MSRLQSFHPAVDLRWLKAFAFAALVIGPLASWARSSEPAEAFLDGLRQRHYHDVALEYLDDLPDNPSVSDAFKETIAYQRGLTLIDQSRYQRDPAVRAGLINRAEEYFQEFIDQHPDHSLIALASTQLGNVLVEQARYRVRRAESGRGNKESLLDQSREYFDRANEVFSSRKATIREELEEIDPNINPAETALIDHRDELRREYIQVQLLAANNMYEKAGTFELGSEEGTELLHESAEAFREIYEKYRLRMAGLYAQLHRGHCHKDLGEFADALVFYQELLLQDDKNPAFRPLRIKALRGSMECWLHESVDQLDFAIDSASVMVDTMRRHEEQDPDWVALRYYLALAYKRKGDSFEEGENNRDRDQSYRMARTRAKELAHIEGEFKDQAQELMADLTSFASDEGETADPTTFAEARDAGKNSLDLSESSAFEIRILRERMARVDPEAQEEMENTILEAGKRIIDHREEARHFFRIALGLANEDSSLDEVNMVRYFLCYIYYRIAATEGGESDAFNDAAVLGEFLSTHYPEANGARQSANIAMESYKALFRTADEDDNEFEIDGILRTAEYIVTMWPDQPEAEQALDSLVTFMVRIGEIDKAEAYLDRISEDSPRRGQAELKVGNQLWRNYRNSCRQMELEAASQDLPTAEELLMLREKAAEMLALGVGRFNTGDVDGNLADAMVAMTEVSVENGEIERAIGFLENEDHGLLKLLRQEHPATQRTYFDTKVYMVAIRAYIASVPGASSEDARQERLNGAGEMMDALKEAMGETPEKKRQLLSIYISLASDIQDQLSAELEESKRVALAQAFDAFLSRIARSPEAEIRELLWVGEAYRSLGESFDDKAEEVSGPAKQYYEQSVDTFQNLLDSAPDNQKQQILIRLAQTQRKLRMYEEAVDAYTSLLRTNANMLNVQFDAAQTLEDWGVHSRNKSKLAEAITGAEPGEEGDNIIWGWAMLQRVTGQNRDGEFRYLDEFYHARYRLGSCRFHIGNISDDDDKNRMHDLAIREILSVHSLYLGPGMESENSSLRDPTNKWYDRFESLLKNIQRSQQVPPTGFSGGP